MSAVFIYYKAPAAQEAEVRQAATRLLAAVHDVTGIAGELLKRSDAQQDGLHTWMEIYRPVVQPDEFLRVLNGTSACTALCALIAGPRQCERFTPV
ncbi:MAG: DUF4936 family protein [Burkholderiaceae bacterium]|nr:MAG: DUF4936 family protein [Burkholderiaceae bacterium]